MMCAVGIKDAGHPLTMTSAKPITQQRMPDSDPISALIWTIWGGLEQLYRITILVFHEDLLATNAADNLVAELNSGPCKSLDSGFQVIDLDDDAIPTARLSLASVGHRFARRGLGVAEPEG